MSLAAWAGVLAGFLAAVGAVRLWRGAQRESGPVRRAYRWFAAVCALWFANVVVGQTVLPQAGAAGAMLSFADLPALLVLPVIATGIGGLAAAGRARAEDPLPAKRSRWELATRSAYLADGYMLASGLFLIGWVTLFGPAFARSGQGPGNFAVELLHPVADLAFLGAMLAAARTAGRRGLLPYLALAAIAVGDALAVGARVSGTRPGAAAVAAQLAVFALLAARRRGGHPQVAASRGARAPEAFCQDGAAQQTGLEGAGLEPRAIAEEEGFERAGLEAGDMQRTASCWAGNAWGVTAAAAAGGAAVLVTVQALVSGAHPAILIILATTAVVLACRVVGLSATVDSLSRMWRQSGWQFRQLAERTGDVVLLCELNGEIRYASRTVADYGHTPGSLCGRSLAGLLHPEDRLGGVRAVRTALAGVAAPVSKYPCRVRAADGTWRHVDATVSRYRNPGRRDQLLVTARDMTAQVALRRQVAHLTYHDGLTGLPNRAYVEQRAQEALSGAGPAAGGDAAAALPAGAARDEAGGDRPAAALAGAPPRTAGVIVLDMDNFTAIIDAAGHSTGDLVLAQVARRLRLAASPEDTVARWGGDEFAVLVGPVTAEELADKAERLARSVDSLPFRMGGSDVNLTVSAGAALAGASAAGNMLRNAELALSRAKDSGGGRVELFEDGLPVAERPAACAQAGGEAALRDGAPAQGGGGAHAVTGDSSVSPCETNLLSS